MASPFNNAWIFFSFQATVIDCGHTFCHYCINQWKKKMSTCPVCRTAFTKFSKPIQLNNFLVRIHSLLPVEKQGRREELVKDRDTEATVARTVELAEQEELRQETHDAVGLSPVVNPVAFMLAAMVRRPRTIRAAAVAMNQLPGPALITLDDSQDGAAAAGALPVPLIPARLPPVTRSSICE